MRGKCNYSPQKSSKNGETSVIDTSCLYVSAPIDEVDATAIRTGMEARITLDAFPKTNFKGRVRRIAPYVLEIEKQARTVEVETVFADLPGNENLLPGLQRRCGDCP
jgi:HlyD family secretion protein